MASLLIVFDALGSSGAMSVQARWNSAISVARLAICWVDEDPRQRILAGHVVVEDGPHVLVVPREDATVAAPDVGEHAGEAGAPSRYRAQRSSCS